MIKVKNIQVNYDKKIALKDISFNIKEGAITTIIGPNGCGKSTLLKALSRNLSYTKGDIIIRHQNLKNIKHKTLAQSMALLPQSPSIPMDYSVKELVGFGRHPFIGFGKRLSIIDYEIIDWAINKCDMRGFKCRRVSTLSGGERQRAWIAMSLAQQPSILLLDEPTTYLDISHQFEVLELIKDINQKTGMTILMVLHDINHAAKYSDEIIVLKDGELFSQGKPEDTITDITMEKVFSLKGRFLENSHYPHFIPEESYK